MHYGIFIHSCLGNDSEKKQGSCESKESKESESKESKESGHSSSSGFASSGHGNISSIGLVSPSIAEEFPSLAKELKEPDKPKPVRKVLKPAAGVGRKLELD